MWMLCICCNGFQVFHVFFASVLDVCFDYFIYIQAYIVSVGSGSGLHLPPRLLLPHLGVSSSSTTLHPSQTMEEARQGPVEVDEPVVGHDANPRFVWLSCVRTRCWHRTSRR
jgi:hypothetical protein